jgi:formylglycine-generating enzyme required for sulfatase activity
LIFRAIPKGNLVLGKDDNVDSFGKSIDPLLPHPIAIKAFYLGETEVSNRQFRSFLDENPDWAPGNVSALAQKALATDGYLTEWVGGKIPAGHDDYPITSVSFHAANAYCEWLTKKLQSTLPGYSARLPTEAEWEWAARGGLRGMPYPLGERPGSAVFFVKGITGPSKAGSSEPNGYELRDMLGNVWEWCSDSFAPSAYLLSSFDSGANAALALSSPAGHDKVVRGGSWNNQRELIKVFTRGSQPAEWCTPYLGFRIAISRQ